MTESPITSVLAVVAVYGRGLDRVDAWLSLRRLLNPVSLHTLRLEHILIYDNSLQPLAKPIDQISGLSYMHDSANGGTAAAYTSATQLAAELRIDWLLLLDQDTHLPENFFEDAAAALKASDATQPAALLPWVYHQSTAVSPAKVTGAGTILPLRRGETLPHGTQVTAIASGSILKVAKMQALLPIPSELWLDFVDHWIFAELHARREHIVIFDNALQHDLSIASPESLSLCRLTSVLDGELRFLESLGVVARFVYPARLILRMLRLVWGSPSLAQHIFGWVMRRLFLKRI